MQLVISLAPHPRSRGELGLLQATAQQTCHICLQGSTWRAGSLGKKGQETIVCRLFSVTAGFKQVRCVYRDVCQTIPYPHLRSCDPQGAAGPGAPRHPAGADTGAPDPWQTQAGHSLAAPPPFLQKLLTPTQPTPARHRGGASPTPSRGASRAAAAPHAPERAGTAGPCPAGPQPALRRACGARGRAAEGPGPGGPGRGGSTSHRPRYRQARAAPPAPAPHLPAAPRGGPGPTLSCQAESLRSALPHTEPRPAAPPLATACCCACGGSSLRRAPLILLPSRPGTGPGPGPAAGPEAAAAHRHPPAPPLRQSRRRLASHVTRASAAPPTAGERGQVRPRRPPGGPALPGSALPCPREAKEGPPAPSSGRRQRWARAEVVCGPGGAGPGAGAAAVR